MWGCGPFDSSLQYESSSSGAQHQHHTTNKWLAPHHLNSTDCICITWKSNVEIRIHLGTLTALQANGKAPHTVTLRSTPPLTCCMPLSFSTWQMLLWSGHEKLNHFQLAQWKGLVLQETYPNPWGGAIVWFWISSFCLISIHAEFVINIFCGVWWFVYVYYLFLTHRYSLQLH